MRVTEKAQQPPRKAQVRWIQCPLEMIYEGFLRAELGRGISTGRKNERWGRGSMWAEELEWKLSMSYPGCRDELPRVHRSSVWVTQGTWKHCISYPGRTDVLYELPKAHGSTVWVTQGTQKQALYELPRAHRSYPGHTEALYELPRVHGNTVWATQRIWLPGDGSLQLVLWASREPICFLLLFI